MKRLLGFILTMLIALTVVHAGAEYAEYEMDTDYDLRYPEFAQDGNLFLGAEDPFGLMDENHPQHLLWIRGREIYRDFEYISYREHPWQCADFMVNGEECYVLLPAGANTDPDYEPAAEVYLWRQEGMEPVARIPGKWDVVHLRTFRDGFSIWDNENGILTTYGSNGTLLASYQLESRDTNASGLIYGSADGIQLYTVKTSSMGHSRETYSMYALQDGEILWEKEYRYSPSVFCPGDGYFYIGCKLEEGNSYSPYSIEKIDSQGNTIVKRTLSANKLVISISMDVDPQTGNTVLYGRAVANSRGEYYAYVLELDGGMNEISTDVRVFDYINDYNIGVYPNPDGGYVVFSRGRDNESGDRIADPVLIPFEILPSADRQRISFK